MMMTMMMMMGHNNSSDSIIPTDRTGMRSEIEISNSVYGIPTASHFLNISQCRTANAELTPSLFGIMLALPEWESMITAVLLSIIIVLTVVGNVLVVLSVFTSKTLRIVQNFYIVSLAIADLTVAVFVLPFSLIYLILGRWEFGIHLCKIWLTCDIMCCTSSILNLCVIALDRYWAITDPVKNAHKRTLNRVLGLIIGIWALSFLISSPPLFGWNDWPSEFTSSSPCQLTSDRGYVIYSSCGSFFIPLFVMTVVYLKIYIAMRRRLRERILMPSLPAAATGFSETNPEQREITIRSFIVCCRNGSFDGSIDESVDMSQVRKDLEIVEAGREFNQYTRSTTTTTRDVPHSVDGKKRNKIRDQKKVFERSFSDAQKFLELKQKAVLSKERRAARTLGIIMGVFVICWLPFFLMYIILPFCATCCPSERFKYFITWLGYINSGLNPVIYTIFNMDYRKAFKRLLGLN